MYKKGNSNIKYMEALKLENFQLNEFKRNALQEIYQLRELESQYHSMKILHDEQNKIKLDFQKEFLGQEEEMKKREQSYISENEGLRTEISKLEKTVQIIVEQNNKLTIKQEQLIEQLELKKKEIIKLNKEKQNNELLLTKMKEQIEMNNKMLKTLEFKKENNLNLYLDFGEKNESKKEKILNQNPRLYTSNSPYEYFDNEFVKKVNATQNFEKKSEENKMLHSESPDNQDLDLKFSKNGLHQEINENNRIFDEKVALNFAKDKLEEKMINDESYNRCKTSYELLNERNIKSENKYENRSKYKEESINKPSKFQHTISQPRDVEKIIEKYKNPVSGSVEENTSLDLNIIQSSKNINSSKKLLEELRMFSANKIRIQESPNIKNFEHNFQNEICPETVITNNSISEICTKILSPKSNNSFLKIDGNKKNLKQGITKLDYLKIKSQEELIASKYIKK